ncbi:MAG: DUF1080 domain-containing protein [Planctomycetes bacterium]|nr:DUF1080 domain-containing protein [Planctomycetota bacterium]
MLEKMVRMAAVAAVAAVLVVPAASATAADKTAGDDGFVSIFNGKDLSDWDGDPALWSVRNGVIRGETTPQKKAAGNTFLIWKGGELGNFVLRLKFRVGQSNNSGVQFRSVHLPFKPTDRNKWIVKGYQMEVQEKPGKVGFLYDEKRRGWLVNVGDFMVLDRAGGKLQKKVVGKIADKQQLIKEGYYKSSKDPDAWNEYEITCRGNHIVTKLNGYQTIELIDNDKEQRTLKGILALQIHAGAPMWVEFKDIAVKKLPEKYGEAVRLFDGKTFDGWTFSSDKVKSAWSIKDGALCTKGKPVGYIRTVESYTNYVLRVQIRHDRPCNGGVLLRMVGPDKVWPRSIECQGMKNNMGDIWNIDKFPMKTAADRTRGRRTTKIHPSNEKPCGQWNQYEIYINKGLLKIYVNGLLQNEATDVWETPGKIVLQSEGGPLCYRNIVLIPILDEQESK